MPQDLLMITFSADTFPAEDLHPEQNREQHQGTTSSHIHCSTGTGSVPASSGISSGSSR